MFSFQKKYRILSSKEFLLILKTRPRIHGQFFRVYLHIININNITNITPLNLNNNLDNLNLKLNANLRLGLVVPKRLCKKAVNRNLIKRQLRENFRLNILHAEYPNIKNIKNIKNINDVKDIETQTQTQTCIQSQINLVFYLSKKLPEQIDQNLLKIIKDDISQINQKIKNTLNKI